eukprot:6466672-Amphidinium_carterae.1
MVVGGDVEIPCLLVGGALEQLPPWVAEGCLAARRAATARAATARVADRCARAKLGNNESWLFKRCYCPNSLERFNAHSLTELLATSAGELTMLRQHSGKGAKHLS